MPMHDWTRVKAGTYHNFHYRWVAAIMDRLNAGLLPSGFFAMAEQIIGRPETDVVTLQRGARPKLPAAANGGVAIAPVFTAGVPMFTAGVPMFTAGVPVFTAGVPVRPKTRFVLPIPPDQERYARKANRIVIHHELGEVVAVIEIVSPGNKDRKHSLQTFAWKAVDLLQQQVNLLIIDPFPPGPHDPSGIHAAIWSELTDQPFELPKDKPLTLAAYQVAPMKTAYVETIAVGDHLPVMPLFLYDEYGIDVPLDETYQTTWNVLPIEIRQLLEPANRS